MALIAALVVTACGGADPPAAGTAASTAPAPATTAPPEHDVAVWFLDGGEPVRLVVRAPVTEGVARQALELVLAEPPAGYETAVPEGLALEDIAIADTVATVGVADEAPTGAALVQIVNTLTEFPTVRWVRFGDDPGLVNRTIAATGQDAPPWLELTRVDVVAENVSFAGTADVFEANVQVRLVQGETVLAESFVTATCGTGCRGSFDGAISAPEGTSGAARLEVFTLSAEDGSVQDVVARDVTLG